MKKNLFFKTLVFLIILLLFVVLNTEWVLESPFDEYEEYIVMDQSDDYDLLRLADIDDEKVAYGFYASAPCTLNFEVNDVIIETIIYESIDPIEITLDANDESIVSLSIIGESFSNELEFKHINSFNTYHTTLFADHLETPSFDETLLVQRSVVLLIWDTGLKAQIITIVITMLLYVFFLGTPQFLTKFKHIKFNIWLKRIFLHLIGSFAFYGLIIFILVFFWGEEDEDGLYDSVTIYEDTTNAFDLTATLGITKVNGLSKEALEVIYIFDLKELSKTEVVGQLYCHNSHVQRVYGYHHEKELNHIATEVYIKDDCHEEDGLRLDVYNNQTGMLLTSYSDIPLVVDSDMAMNDYGLSYESLGTIFSIGVFSFAALVLMPLLEYWDYRYRTKHSNKERDN